MTSISGLSDEVDAILGREADPSTALEALRHAIPLPEYLDACRTDSRMLADLTARSYRHDNGFDKIVLAQSLTGSLKFVLHVWQPGKERSLDNIHNHRWEFASVVLCGALQLDLYQFDLSGVSYPRVWYLSPEDSEAYQTEPDGDTAVSVRASVTMAAGTTYTWASDLLHRAWGVGSPLTATLIVQGRPARDSTTVLVRQGPVDASVSGERHLTRLREEHIAQTLTWLTNNEIESAWRLLRSRSR